MIRKRPLLISLLVILLAGGYYFGLQGYAFSIKYLNATIAVSGAVIIAISMLISPVSKIIPQTKTFLKDAREFGLIGFGLAALHVIFIGPTLIEKTYNPSFADIGSIAVGIIAFIIFLLMALTSTSKWIATLGMENWKNLQRTGFLALIFLMAHIGLIASGALVAYETILQGVMAIILLTLLIRAVVFILQFREKKQQPPIREKLY